MRCVRLLLCVGIGLLLGLSSAPLEARCADDETLVQTAQHTARAAAVEQLVALGDWCTENDLFARRAVVAKQILAFDASHRRAHRWLHHRLLAGGKWGPPPSPYQPRDRNSDALDAYAAQRETLLRPAQEKLEHVIKEHRTRVRPVELMRVRRDLLILDPDNATYRRAVGETRVDGVWMLIETATAHARRRTLRDTVRELERVDVKVEPTEPNENEFEYEIVWTGHVRCGDVRVIGTVKQSELRETARLAELAGRVFRKTFNVKTRLGDGFTAYVFAERKASQQLLERHRHVSDAQRAEALAAPSYRVGFSYDVVVHHVSRRVRSTQVVRQAFTTLLRDTYALSDEPGWLREGLTIRLTQDVIGSTLGWPSTATQYGREEKELASKMFATGADWRQLARAHVINAGAPDLSRLQALQGVLHRPSDLLLGYALATYLLEGRPAELTRFLAEVRKGAPADWALRRITGLDDELLAEHLTRWLKEAVKPDLLTKPDELDTATSKPSSSEKSTPEGPPAPK